MNWKAVDATEQDSATTSPGAFLVLLSPPQDPACGGSAKHRKAFRILHSRKAVCVLSSTSLADSLVLSAGFEPAITVPKTVVISISPRERFVMAFEGKIIVRTGTIGSTHMEDPEANANRPIIEQLGEMAKSY